ncbi:SDR family NAD(P)-dependent oxidoreductase [Streptomyces sp. NPDC000851]
MTNKGHHVQLRNVELLAPRRAASPSAPARDRASGIGQATAIALAESGAHVLGVGRRQGAPEETARAHANIAVLSSDVCEEGTAERIVSAAVERCGRLDLLVNNAGIAALMPLAETDRTVIANLFELHVTAPSLLARAALPHLRSSSTGSIVNDLQHLRPPSPGRRGALRRPRAPWNS